MQTQPPDIKNPPVRGESYERPHKHMAILPSSAPTADGSLRIQCDVFGTVYFSSLILRKIIQ